ncbi:3-hydroxyacyl-CoA dehydrogenase NAD-binding domain-containing protein [Parvularcula sp. LCG005]|uniref:3-hydroxyacyl-CoA dehydrogenase NAD-binding domain-containing protein n=1 Tax=Parvularcula sp. LCG005 TaxID=3078805 RepID=UPI002942790D|nr:3-hydroxyacyl-CoA dehydrogenase NAD-binding domain-containing protein [Parvularcula sp. LCG005]WOI52442.1 3-hydroxyacyl-CoA dehydrogenase NAD-binding domain-containing protein [Parvularcula sp. LCG005]
MTYTTFSFDVDADGIALLTIDLPNQSMNVWNAALIEEFEQAIDKFCTDDSIKGLVVTSGKDSGFLAGADLNMIASMPEDASPKDIFEANYTLQRLLRKMETAGQSAKDLVKGTATAKPVAAAINGLALGGGMELALACHYRVASDNPKLNLGQPEVMVGLIPGAGGTQRIMRLAGVQAAMQICTQGKNMDANAAKAQGLIHEIAPHAEIVAKAKEWVKANPKSTQPWDKKGFKIPGGAGAMDPRVVPTFAGSSAIAQGQTNHNYPAVQRILSAIYEGSITPIDVALRIESKYFTQCLMEPQARNMIRTLFVNKGAAEKGAARPEGVPKSQIKKVGVLGAGMMGAGIAYVTARAGMEVVLLDRDVEAAEKGKSYTAKLNDKGVSRGKITKDKAEAILNRIATTADYADLADVDLIIEAVFEDPKVKADVIKATEAVIKPEVIFATNTSTIPIGNLSKNSSKPDQFIGIHFFSPVDKMPLVEIIPHSGSGDAALATALDYVGMIKKTPIVVRDYRGFYCNSVVLPYLNEAALMVKEGISPVLIDNCAVHMGMPVGPLALTDEVSQELGYNIMKAAQAEEGDNYKPTGVEEFFEKFVVELGRKGKKVGKGYYEYPEGGAKKYMWPGLAELFPLQAVQPSPDVVKERLMFLQLVAAAHLFAEDVVHDPQSADLGAIFGWGFCPWTGGPMSYIDTIGVNTFVETAERLASEHGERFDPPQMFKDLAAKNGKLYAA